MSEKYLIGKEYMENAIYRAFKEGQEFPDKNDVAITGYVDSTIDDMLRGDKPFEGEQDIKEGAYMIGYQAALDSVTQHVNNVSAARMIAERNKQTDNDK